MSPHFSRSFRALDGDGFRLPALTLALVLAVLGLWAAWFFTARVAVYAATESARVAVEQDNHPIDAPVGGRIVVGLPEVGRHVQAGDVLMELDANVEQLAKNEAEARLTPSAAQLTSLTRQLEAEQRALQEDRRGAEAAIAQSRAAADQAASAAQLANEEASRLATLHARGLVSELDALRAKKMAEEQQAQARAAEAAAQLATRDRGTQQQDRTARIASLTASIAALQGTRNEVEAASARLGYEIERRQIRAPISGTIAEVSPLRVGSVVKPGDRIASIVPPGGLKVVALFQPAEAVGRVRIGQAARVRFEGFPWTQYGSTPAHVTGVATEVRDGTIRTELSLDAATSSIPLQHGLPAEVDVEVEQVSPAGMVLRTVGRQLLLSSVRARS